MAARGSEARWWRLAAILAADVVASSRLMAEDEGKPMSRKGGP